MKRQVFTIPGQIASDAPMNTSPYFKWLMKSVTRHNSFFTSLESYLAPGGYDKKLHTLDPIEYKSLECIFNHYSAMYTPIKNPCRIRALLDPTPKSDNGFHLWGDDCPQHITTILKYVLNDLGLVYDITPQNYYFEVKNGYLFIVYQQILGSRRLAKIVTDQEAFNQSTETK